jgi:hypothetical protein
MIEDLELEEEDSGARPPGPAFYTTPAATEAEMHVIELMHRTGARPEFRGAGVVIFTREDEETDGEIWEDGEAAHWRKIMSWPRDPTIAEAMAWQRNADARLEAFYWDRIEAVRTGRR